MALTRAERMAAAHEAGFVAGFEDAATQIFNMLTDSEHATFYARRQDARTLLLELIDVVKELEYGTIPTYREG